MGGSDCPEEADGLEGDPEMKESVKVCNLVDIQESTLR